MAEALPGTARGAGLTTRFRGRAVPVGRGHAQVLVPKVSFSRPRGRVVARSRVARVVALTDYTASAADDGVLQLPAKQELQPEMVKQVFGYPRDMNDKYRIGKVLGAGSFGVVREATELLPNGSGRTYAVKSIPKVPRRGRLTPRYLLKLRQEVEAMEQLGASLDAVYLKDTFEDSESIHLVMELCQGGGLLDRFQQHAYSERYIASIVKSICRFLSQCHSKGIVYRDVKPDNFLFLDGSAASPLKATDFGLSIKHGPDEQALSSRSGTPAYMAPEVLMQSYDAKADVWSMGMLTYQLLTGRFPFWDNIRNCTLQDVWQAILNKPIDFGNNDLKGLSPEARDFLRCTLDRAPKQRWDAARLLHHPWLAGDNSNSDIALEGSVVQRLQRFATYSHLKQMVLRLITDDLQLECSLSGNCGSMWSSVTELFEALDTDHSGSISLIELTDGLQQQGYKLSEDEVAQLLERIDLDHNGSVQLSELAAGLLDWEDVQRMTQDKWMSWMRKAFDRIDTDASGYLDVEELSRQLAASTGGDVMSSSDELMMEAKRLLREADSDLDGKISFAEFLALVLDAEVNDDLEQYDSRLQLPDLPVDEELETIDL